ncbi:MAG TPA: glycosyltransferase family 87 protein [Candidatus Hydrogenedentes bacterium]|jgi:hypothetical protein|nr:glycosyltransferase family 87 protein [Candidatus Hydrogenedentota bacterium]
MEEAQFLSEQQGLGRRRVARAATALLAVYALAVVVKIAVQTDRFQVNFQPYYYAALAFSRGLNPYDSEVTRELAGGEFVLPYAYPPLTLNLLRPFALGSFETSYRCFLALKCVALGLCLWLWQRKFLGSGIDNVFLLVCLIGFNYAIYWDIHSGNISFLAQTVLWLGLYAYLRGRPGWFIALTVGASLFKYTPGFFLVLLLFVEGRKKWGWCAVGGAAFVLLHGASYLLYPQLMPEFLENIGEIQGLVPVEAGPVENFDGAPATWPLIKTLFTNLSEKLSVSSLNALPVFAFAALALAICGITWKVLRADPCADPRECRLVHVVFACLVYLMLTPRLMVGEYTVGLLPAYYIVRRMRYAHASLLLIALMAPSPITGRPPGFKFLVETCTNYYPLLTVYALWALGLYVLWRERSHPPRTQDAVS